MNTGLTSMHPSPAGLLPVGHVSGAALAVGADPAVAVEDEDASFPPGCAGSPGAFLAGSFAAEGAAGAAVAGVDGAVLCEVVGRHARCSG